ncbi:MAG: hypothetical protein Tsb0010_12040 [Parvularculaceae bacterium]
MKRIGLLIIIAGLGAILIAAAAAIVYLNTARGRAETQRFLTDRLSAAIGYDLSIGAAEGAWPHHISLRNIRISDVSGEWASAEALDIRWRPLALVFGRISVSDLSLRNADLERLPAAPARDGAAPQEPGRSVHLPRIGIRKLTIENFAFGDAVAPGGGAIDLYGRLQSRRGEEIAFDLRGDIGAARIAQELRQWGLGGKVAFNGRGAVNLASPRLALDAASISIDGAALSLERTELRPDGSFSAAATLYVAPPPETADALPDEIAKLLGEKARLAFEAQGAARGAVEIRNLELFAADETRLLAGALDMERREEFTLSGALGLAPAALNRLFDGATLSDEVALQLRARLGAPQHSLTLSLNAPPFTYENVDIPALAAEFDGRGGLRDFSGAFRASARRNGEPAGALSLRIRRNGDALSLDGLDLRYLGAHLSGAASADLADRSANARFDLSATDLAGPSHGLARGDVEAAMELSYGEGRLAANGAASSDWLAFEDYEIRGAVLRLDNGRLDLDRLSPALEGGAEAAEIVTPFAAFSSLSITAAGGGEAIDITAAIGAIRKDREIARDARARLAIRAAPDGQLAEIEEFSALIDDIRLQLAAPTRLAIRDGAVILDPARFRWDGDGAATLSGAIDPGRWRGDAEFSNLRHPLAPARVSGVIRLDTDLPEPATVTLDIDPVVARGPDTRLQAAGEWDSERLVLRATIEGEGEDAAIGSLGTLEGAIPLRLIRNAGQLRIDAEGDLEATFRYDGAVAPVLAVFPTGDHMLRGRLQADARLFGPRDALRAEGRLSLTGGVYEHFDLGARFDALSAEAQLRSPGGALILDIAAQARAGDGGVAAKARAAFSGPAPEISGNLTLREAKLVRRGDFDMTASGDLTLTGAYPNFSVRGDLAVDRLDAAIPDPPAADIVDIRVAPVDDSGQAAARVATPKGAPRRVVALDLAINAEDQIFIRGRGVDSEWRASARIAGASDDPQISANVDLIRGVVDFAGRRFDLTRGQIQLQPQRPGDPRLNLRAESSVERRTADGANETVRVAMEITGTASAPRIALSSAPALPQPDIMALILFGKPATELTAVESLQIAQALANLAGAGPFGGPGIFDRIRRSIGVDSLRLTSGGANGSTTFGLEVGKYVAEGVYVSASQDMTRQSGLVTVEIDLTDRFSLETELGQDANSKISLNWKRDY